MWSAPVSDPTKWVCHGDIFRSRDGHDSPSDVDWTDELLFAPDVVERGGKYYLYAYIVNAKAVSYTHLDVYKRQFWHFGIFLL